ncbi:MAG: thioredoxin domain-containing protein [Candidatus Pacearchaeota archaeon]|jgi:protein-disulfide isomerase
MEEEKTVTISKLTIWKSAVVILVIALAASILTGGFGIKGSTGAAVNTQNTGATQQQGTTNADLSAFTSNSDLYPSLGPDNAKNTVVEFADFQCPYCALASGLPSWTSQFASQYGSLIGAAGSAEQAAQQGQIKFVFVTMNFLDNPTSTNGTESTYAAEAGFCANDQGQFWAMHDAIYKASTGPTEDDGKYTKANLIKLAQGISGLDITKFTSCLNSDTDLSKVQQSASVASAIVQGTPSFYVNGQSVQPSWTAIQAAFK